MAENLPKTTLIHEAVNADLLLKVDMTTGIPNEIVAATAKTPLVDADIFAIVETTTLKKTLWSTIKSTLKTYFDGLYATITSLADYIPYTGGTSNVDLGIHNLTVDTNSLFVDSVNHRVGIGTTAPTNLLSLGGDSARIFWLERHTTANTAGNILTITAGGATAAATDKAGGALILQGGLSTGTGESGVTIKGCVAGATGTTDRTQTTAIQVLGNKVGFYAATPVVQQTGCAVPTDLETCITAITALRTALNALGLTTTV